MRHRAGIKTALLVFQLLLQQVHGSFMHGDLLRGQQHIVVRQTHAQQRVGHRAVVLGDGLFLRCLGGAEGGLQPATFIDGLDDLNPAIPALMRRLRAGIILDERDFVVLILGAGLHLGQRHGARLHHHTV